MLWTIIMVIAILIATYHLAYKFGDREVIISHALKAVIVAAAAVLLKSYLIPKLPEFSLIYLIVTLGFIVGLCYQFFREGDEPNEFVASAVLIVIAGNLASAAATNYASVVPMFLAIVMPIGAVGFCAISALIFNRNEADDEDRPTFTRWLIMASILTLILLGVGAKVAFSINERGSVDDKSAADSTPATLEVEAEDEEPLQDARFVQKWTSNENNRLDNEFASKLAAKAGDGEITSDIVEEAVLENCGHDARMLAIWANAFELWDDPNDYESLMTSDKKYLSEEGIQLYHKLEGYLAATKIVREEAPADGTNTGYDDGYVASETAGITGDRTGTKFTSPDENVEQFWLMDRCSNLVYKKTPNVPTGNTDNPNPPGIGDNPTPTPTPTPKYNKDPNKAPKKNTEPNDDKGPGPNTNNPSNPNRSTKDTNDSSSNSGKTYEDYKKDIKEKEDTNKTQKTGNDSNKPSTTPAPSTNTKVDNNGDKGNGGDPINTPTPKKEAETVKNDPPAGHMDEPS